MNDANMDSPDIIMTLCNRVIWKWGGCIFKIIIVYNIFILHIHQINDYTNSIIFWRDYRGIRLTIIIHIAFWFDIFDIMTNTLRFITVSLCIFSCNYKYIWFTIIVYTWHFDVTTDTSNIIISLCTTFWCENRCVTPNTSAYWQTLWCHYRCGLTIMSSCVTLWCKLVTKMRYPWRGLSSVGVGFSSSISTTSSSNLSYYLFF